MSRISTAGSLPPVPSSNGSVSGDNDLNSVDIDEFLKLLITELQNQDPLNPMENEQLLQQISLIREIGATDQLTNTLSDVRSGQNVATASSLIGKTVRALSDSLEDVEGVVERVSMSAGEEGNREIRVHVGNHEIRLENIREIVDANPAQSP